MSKIGIITGLKSEAQCFANTDVADNADVRVAAAVTARARECAQELVAGGCSGLVSFGIAGGLDPRLKTGALVLANEIIAPDGRRFETDEDARNRLRQSLGRDFPVSQAPMMGSDTVIMSPRRKVNFHVENGAAAVDMESHAVGEVAAEAGLPFLVIRAVSDHAYSRIPKAIIGGLGPDGGRRPLRVVLNLIGRPFDLPGLIRLQRGSTTAHKVLRSVAVAGGPFLGLR